LVVAGGGGGGGNHGGGGGAGGYRTSTLSVSASTAYTITVGAGGGASQIGQNSVFSSITSTGGKAIVSKESLVQLKVIVQQMGATKLQAAVRPSMKRLLSRTGFYDRYQIVETKL
jgi:hypothetical protein